jgi:internalin A
MSNSRYDFQDDLGEALRRIEECRRTGKTTLDLSGLKTLRELPEALFELAHLEELVLENNDSLEALPEALGRLVNLKKLRITKQERLRRLPDALGELVELRELTIGDTKVDKLPDGLCKLVHLETLIINNNSIKAVPSNFGCLVNLRRLDLRAIYLESLPESFARLTELTTLDLTRNALEILPEQVCRLGNLRELVLTSNKLTELPDAIGDLKQLRVLVLAKNHLTGLPSSISGCSGLETLEASENLLTTLPPSIGRLKYLKKLNLEANLLSRLPSTVGGLAGLEWLDLSRNRLRYIPRQLGHPSGLVHCDLTRNRTDEKPQEAFNRREDLDRFLERMWSTPPQLREARLILVGEGERGKTTLKHALIRGRALRCEQTHGIDIDCWPIDPPAGSGGVPIDVDVWDFGGQIIYHQVHHLYLAHKAVYLLVFDTRKDLDSRSQIEGWLEAIRTYGKGGPIIFVQNLRGSGETLTEDEFRAYQKQYPNLVGLVSMPCLAGKNSPCQDEDSKTAELCQCETCAGLALLQEIIGQLLFAPVANDLGDGLGLVRVLNCKVEEWELRNELETIGAANDYPVLGRTEAEERCRQGGLGDGAERFLADLHGQGQILAYDEDARDGILVPRSDRVRDELYGKVVLRPSWAKDAIYDVFGSARIKRNGLLLRSDVASLWDSNPARYPRESHNYLLALMESYQLGYSHDQSLYVFPYFLPHNPPPEAEFDPSDATRLEYHYKKFFHISLMSRLIVRMSRDLARVGNKELCWKRGAILSLRHTGVDHRGDGHEVARARIEFREGFRKITVELAGPRRLDLLERIREGLRDVHGSYVEADEWVPCPCRHCQGSDDPTLFLLSGVRQVFIDGAGGDYFVRCLKGDCERVDVRTILNGPTPGAPHGHGRAAVTAAAKAASPCRSRPREEDFVAKVNERVLRYTPISAGGKTTDILIGLHPDLSGIVPAVVSPILAVCPVARQVQRRRGRGDRGDPPAISPRLPSIDRRSRLIWPLGSSQRSD